MRVFLGLAALLATANAAPYQTITETIVTVSLPAYFQTTPEIYALSTATGAEPFLVQTNPAPEFLRGSVTSYIPPAPLETQEPIKGAPSDGNIFTLLGNLSPYSPSPGFGIDELPIPDGAEVSWLNMIARHGSRYPTDPIALGSAIEEAVANGAKFSGELSFLNSWSYSLGVNILVPVGRQELYDNGVQHAYQYGHLFNPNQTQKLVARTTTQDRLRKSAENFLSGFFDLDWSDFAMLEVIIDEPGFNNSLAGYNACPNNQDYHTSAGANASDAWIAKYATAAAKRFNKRSAGFTWNTTWIYQAQQLCSYETIGLGYSSFCDLFTYQEWEYFEYSIDLDFAGTFAFASPTARGVGVGYVEEVLARIDHHLITKATGSDNVTLDNMTSTFPLNQTLNFDFTHEVNLMSVLTAFGLKQFAPFFPDTNYTADRELIISHIVPFGCRLDISIIDAPAPISANRSTSTNTTSTNKEITTSPYEASGNATRYIHFVLNQRTIPLGKSYPKCGNRSDGWCELNTWLGIQRKALQEADYSFACYGNYTPPKYGQITNGAIYPTSSTTKGGSSLIASSTASSSSTSRSASAPASTSSSSAS